MRLRSGIAGAAKPAARRTDCRLDTTLHLLLGRECSCFVRLAPPGHAAAPINSDYDAVNSAPARRLRTGIGKDTPPSSVSTMFRAANRTLPRRRRGKSSDVRHHSQPAHRDRLERDWALALRSAFLRLFRTATKWAHSGQQYFLLCADSHLNTLPQSLRAQKS